jgi:predicted CXXCH cytochrome family protein
MKRLLAAAALLLSQPAVAGTHTIEGSKHDFSSRSKGKFRAATETNACKFCHLPHGAGGQKLTSRPDPAGAHVPYGSSTMKANRALPTGTSRLCLSCHDGTIAIGKLRRGEIAMAGQSRLPQGHRANLGTDLSSSHPVSVSALSSARVRAPTPGDQVHLDGAGLVQCTSCHDPHDEWRDEAVGKFLVKPSADAALCNSCHVTGTGTAAQPTHLRTARASEAVASRAAFALAGMSAGNNAAGGGQCSACHVQHAADKRGRLTRPETPGDDACLQCHGDAAKRAITTDLAKPSTHAKDERLRHDAGEAPDAPANRRLPETSVGSPRHVSCMDCHDPHASVDSTTQAPRLTGAMVGAWGVDLDGHAVVPARYEYEVCLKCHGDSANKPQGQATYGRGEPVRQSRDVNLRNVFSSSALSSHPVAAPGRTAVVPSLKAPLTSASQIRCTDCHNSDSARSAGGPGSNGPHGSVYPHLLERQYRTQDPTPESAEAYALCYKCHDRKVLLSPTSSFAPHSLHVAGASTPCSACHVAHGVSFGAAVGTDAAHLVSFDLSVVRPNRAGELRYQSIGTGRGSCALSCHGVEHRSGTKYWAY